MPSLIAIRLDTAAVGGGVALRLSYAYLLENTSADSYIVTHGSQWIGKIHCAPSMISIRCQCGRTYFASGKEHGKKIRCTKCDRELIIPPELEHRDDSGVAQANQPHQRNIRKTGPPIRSRELLQMVLIAVSVIVLVIFFSVDNPFHKEAPVPVPNHREKDPPAVSVNPKNSDLAVEPISPIRFSIGALDPRFGIARETLLSHVEEAASIWEKSLGSSLFQYDSSASFTISLTFDERQQRLIEERELRAKLNESGTSYNILKERYDSEVHLKEQLENAYESDRLLYTKKLNELNSRIAYWNARGGAPHEELVKLTGEQAALQAEGDGLERRRHTLNKVANGANEVARTINELVRQNNLDVTYFNGRFVRSREFEKGVFNGAGINIYEFDGDADLTITLVHELGHALGFAHVDDPESIMYYKLEEQDRENIHLTASDLRLLSDRFHRQARNF